MLKDRIQESISRGKITELSAFSGFQDRMRSMVQDEVTKFKDEIIAELRRLLEERISEEGINTIKGERGYTPQKGIDYHTPEEIQQMKIDITPIKGIHYFDGVPGINGRTPSIQQISRIISNELRKIKPEKLDIESMAQAIARAIEKLQGELRLDYLSLKNRPGIEVFGRKKFGGRGGGGGSNELTATGVVNGTNTVFSFALEPRYIVSDGVFYKKNGGWTWSSPNATLTIPPTYSLWGLE